MRETRIDTRQMASLIFLSRVFVSLTFSPNEIQNLEPTVSMLGSFLALLTNLFLLYLLQRFLALQGGGDIIDCAGRAHPLWGKVCAGVMAVFCLLTALYTMCNFQYFMSTAVYPNLDITSFLLLFGVAVCYGAWLGLEAFSRFGILVSSLVGVVTLILMLGVFQDFDPVFLQSPFQNGIQPLALAWFTGVAANQEIGAFLLLAPLVREKSAGSTAKGLLLGNLYYELLTATTAMVLGSYGRTQSYPIYALIASAELVLIQRLDALHIAIWVFLAYVKTVLYLYLSVLCLNKLWPAPHRDKTLVLLGGAMVVLGLWVTRHIQLLGHIIRFANGGVPYVAAVLLLPAITLALGLLRKKKEAEA